jgi:hypothetical protein
MSAITPQAAVDHLLLVLESARERPHMYFQPIEPSQVISWIDGLHTGFSIFGLAWDTEHRREPLRRRGLELNAAQWEVAPLAERGSSLQAIVSELLAIEHEMWQSIRSAMD